MADLTFNKIAGAALATGLVIFGLQNLTAIVFEKEAPTKAGYAIAVSESTGGGGEAPDVLPDWGTVLPKADVAAGQAVTAKCASCHQFDPAGTNGTGPGLYGVEGRKPASHPGYSYDQAMTDFASKDPVWTYDLLYQFLKAPQGFIPGVKMTFVGLKSPQDRINVIAYLHTLGASLPIPAPNPKAAAPASPASNAAAASNSAAPSNAVAASNAAAATNGAQPAPATKAGH
jgi:cytochrome c